jgi:hypothetical protein
MTQITMRLRAASAVAVAIMLSAIMIHPVAAQGRAEGSITGTVIDDTKGVLPGATVTARNAATGFSRTSVSDGGGAYVLPLLPPGRYELTAELQGFRTFMQIVVVTVGSDQTVAIGLSVSNLQESVTVTGDAPLVEVTRTQQSTTVGENEVRSLPINGRSFVQYAMLAPGVVQSGGSFSVGGQRDNQNALNIDGMANRSYDDNNEAGNFSAEAVQEFEVITQSANAEYGQNTGSVLNAVTKSGTNQYSGYGFYFLRHNSFVKPPFETSTDANGKVTAVTSQGANQFKNQVGGLRSAARSSTARRSFSASSINREQRAARAHDPAGHARHRPAVLPLMPDNDSNRVVQSGRAEPRCRSRSTTPCRQSTTRRSASAPPIPMTRESSRVAIPGTAAP